MKQASPTNTISLKAIILSLVMLLLIWLYAYYVWNECQPSYPTFLWDAACYSYESVKIFSLAKLGHPWDAVQVLLKQSHHPCGYFALLTGSFWIFGPMLTTVIGVNIGLICLILFTGFVNHRIVTGRWEWVAWITPLLWMASYQTIHHSVSGMMEPMIVWVTALGVLFILKWLSSPTACNGIIAGAVSGMLWLVKYNYSLWMLLSLLIFLMLYILNERWHKRDPELKPFAFLFIAHGMILAGWFSYSFTDKYNGMMKFLEARSSGLPLAEDLLYYPKIFFQEFYVSNVWLMAFISIGIIAFAFSCWRSCSSQNMFLIVVFFIGFGMITAHPNKMPRYAMPIAYMLLVICSAGWSHLCCHKKWMGWAGTILLPLCMISQIPRISSAISHDPYTTNSIHVNRILNTLESALKPNEKNCFIGSFDQVSSYLVLWRMQIERGYPTPMIVFEGFMGERRPERDFPAPYEVYEQTLLRFLSSPNMMPVNVVTVDITERSRFYTDDYQRYAFWKKEYIHAMEKHFSDKMVFDENLEDLGVRIRAYRLESK